MDIQVGKRTAARLEDRVDAILAAMTEVLREQGIEGVRVVDFGVEPEAGRVGARELPPCPTKCRLRPDGTIRCRPEC